MVPKINKEHEAWLKNVANNHKKHQGNNDGSFQQGVQADNAYQSWEYLQILDEDRKKRLKKTEN